MHTLPYRWSVRTDTVNISSEDWLAAMVRVSENNGSNIGESDERERYFNRAIWMATDSYGRRLYYVEGYYYTHDEENVNLSYYQYYIETVAIINPDGSYDPDTFMTELADKTDYQGRIKALKEANGWNQPLKGGSQV